MASEESEKVYELIVDRCRALRDGKYIMSAMNMVKLLQCIVDNEESMEYLKKCNDMYAYGNELYSAAQDKKFVMPINKHRVIVLVTGLLRQFLYFDRDAHAKDGLDCYKFIRKYYPSVDIDKSFSLFVDSVIFPYSKAFRGMITDDDDDNIALDESSDSMEKLNDNVKEQLYPCISRLNEVVVADNTIFDVKKKEYLAMIEGFNYVLELGNTKLINVVFIGLKNTFVGYKNSASYVKYIEEILTAYKSI